MELAILLPVLATAVSVGLGCGTRCSPAVSIFLSSYIITHSGGMKKSLGSFMSFFLGKVLAVVVLCGLAALIGSTFISDSGYVGSFNLRLILEFAMVMLGLFLIGKWIYDFKHPKAPCGGCGGEKKLDKKGVLPLLALGFAYGASPCAPLLLIIGVSATLSLPAAVLTATVFSVASTLTPILLMILLSGALSGRISKEIPRQLPYFQLASYVVITLLSAGAMINIF
jgi:hypothetical protein